MKMLPAQSSTNVSVRRHVSSLHGPGGFPDWWEPLHEAACNTAVFLSREWMETWLETYGSHFDGQWVWWSCDGKVVGGCLLLMKSIKIGGVPFRTLFLNAAGFTPERSPLAECNDVLYVDGYADGITDDMLALLSELKWQRFELLACLSDGIISRVVHAIPAIKSEIQHKPAPYINFVGLPDAPYEKHLTGNARSQIHRCRRIYEAADGAVVLASARTLEEALQCFERLVEMHNSRWSLKGMAGSFSSRLAVQFHKKIIGLLWPSGAVELLAVRAGSREIGILYNFITDDKVQFFQSGFVYQENNKLKPGMLTHSLAIEHYRVRGMREYDFLVGDSQYKRSFANNVRTQFGGVIYCDCQSVRVLFYAKKLKALLASWKKWGAVGRPARSNADGSS